METFSFVSSLKKYAYLKKAMLRICMRKGISDTIRFMTWRSRFPVYAP